MRMRVPMTHPGRLLRVFSGWILVALAVPVMAAPKAPQPVQKLSLRELGFPGYSLPFLDAGSSMLTLNFVDSEHLLVTFSMRELLERLADDPKEDEDRAVSAVLVELPGGKVLARARWRLHDHGRYLWPIGEGRFLLRIRSNLVAIAPLANLHSGDAFRQTQFARVTGQLDGVVVSADHEVVTLESSIPRKKTTTAVAGAGSAGASSGASGGDAPQGTTPGGETLTFGRVVGAGSAEDPVRAIHAGVVRARVAVEIPLNGRGYMVAERGNRGRWAVKFEGYDGRTRQMAPVDSSCAPRVQMVSLSQFIVFSCRGDQDHTMLAAYDFSAHEVWEEPLAGIHAFAYTTVAPESGRFALSRATSILSMAGSSATGATLNGATNVPQEQLGTQEVRVYQTESGDLLMKVATSPVMRAGQNFDLSPDGMMLGVVNRSYIELYRLPALSATDKKDLAELRGLEPPAFSGNKVDLRKLTDATDVAGTQTEEQGNEPETRKAAVAALSVEHGNTDSALAPTEDKHGEEKHSAAPGRGAVAAGHDESDAGAPGGSAPRPAPTLLGPDEKPESAAPPK